MLQAARSRKRARGFSSRGVTIWTFSWIRLGDGLCSQEAMSPSARTIAWFFDPWTPNPARILPSRLSLSVQSFGLVPGRDEVAYVSSASDERRLLFLDIASEKITREMPLLLPGERPSTSLCNMRFSPNGQRLAIANYDARRVDIYEVASGRRLFSLQ